MRFLELKTIPSQKLAKKKRFPSDNHRKSSFTNNRKEFEVYLPPEYPKKSLRWPIHSFYPCGTLNKNNQPRQISGLEKL